MSDDPRENEWLKELMAAFKDADLPDWQPGDLSRMSVESMVARQTGVQAVPVVCPSPCDGDCDADCHEAHQVPAKRTHLPESHRDLADLAVRLAAAEAKISDYENCITWDTTCASCATHLDASYAEHCRAEIAEALIAQIREHTLDVISHSIDDFASASAKTKTMIAAEANVSAIHLIRLIDGPGATTGETT